MNGLPASVEKLSSKLIEWYERQARSLPWRESPSPYAVLVSEIMLQQTQVATVIPYFDRWMKRFPDFPSLAEASEEEVLKYWEGLGYYRRARSLQQLAHQVLLHHDGELPREEAALLALPGIGPYTAGAILSIAFERPFPAVDGNVERVLTRIFDLDLPADKAPGKRRIRELALGLIPEGSARTLNQALMELGATVCLPRTPLCGTCPVKDLCLGQAAGTLADRPVKSARPTTRPLFAGAIILRREGHFLLFRRPSSGLMAGLWEFPTLTFAGLPEADEMRDAVKSALGLDVEAVQDLFTVRHSFTRYRVTMRVFLGGEVLGNAKAQAGWEARWVSPEELRKLTFSAGSRKIRERAESFRDQLLPISPQSLNIR